MESESKPTFLSAEEILALDDLEIVPVYIPSWKSHVRFRVLPADVAQRFQRELDDPAKKNDAWVKIFALSAVNEKGERLFSDQQLEKLRTKSTKVFMQMQEQLLTMNGFTKESREALKNGSSEAGNGASPTDSRVH